MLRDKRVIPTVELFREDGYLRNCEATVIEIVDHSVVVDQTVFYPEGGGQPGRAVGTKGGAPGITTPLIRRPSGPLAPRR